jgi:hypothetical protein
MNTVDKHGIVLNAFGEIDTHFYLNKARQLRNQVIANYIKSLVTQVKTLLTPAMITTQAKTA